MPGDPTPPTETDWLTLPEVAEMLDVPRGRVRKMLDEQQLVGAMHDGAFRIPAIFFVEGAPLSSLRGTIFVLHDAGFSDAEAIDWLLEPEESIGMSPIDALRAGRKSEVRRVAQSIG